MYCYQNPHIRILSMIAYSLWFMRILFEAALFLECFQRKFCYPTKEMNEINGE